MFWMYFIAIREAICTFNLIFITLQYHCNVHKEFKYTSILLYIWLHRITIGINLLPGYFDKQEVLFWVVTKFNVFFYYGYSYTIRIRNCWYSLTSRVRFVTSGNNFGPIANIRLITFGRTRAGASVDIMSI